MGNSGKIAEVNKLRAGGKTRAVQKVPVTINLTDGYQILDVLSINNKISFEELLRVITDSILESIGRAHLKNIYLFGSHAYGKPNKYSDIDLCIVLSNGKNKSKAYFDILKGLNNKKIVSLDVLVYNEREYNDRKSRAGIVNTIFTKGRTLYE
jgi:predicted nucleotidyltransferase